MRPSKLNIIVSIAAGLAVFMPVYFGATWWVNVLAQTQDDPGNLFWLNLAAYGAWAAAGFVAAAVSRGWHLRVGVGVGALCAFVVFAFYLSSGSPSLRASVYEDWYLWLGNGVLLALAGAVLYQVVHWISNVALTKASTRRRQTSGLA